MRSKISKQILPQALLKDKSQLKAADPKLFKEIKRRYQRVVDKNFSIHASNGVKFYERELHLRHHRGYICGYFDDDYAAADYLLMRLDERSPAGIILGECSIDDFNIIKHEDSIYKVQPKVEPVTDQLILGRQKFLNYFQNEMKLSLRYFKDYGDYTISEADTHNRKKSVNINLTVAYWACFKDNVRVILGAPQKMLVLEDLTVFLDLKELRNIFTQTIKYFSDFSKEDLFPPSQNVQTFYVNFRDIVKVKFSQIIYEKRQMYTASVIRKVHTAYDHNLAICDNDLIDSVFRHSIDDLNPDFTKIYRNKDYFSELDNIEASEEELSIVLEKLVILSHIYDRHFRNFIDRQINPIKGLFGGKFDNFEDKLVINKFMMINSKYAKVLETLFYEDVKRFEQMESAGRHNLNTYSDLIKKIEEEKNFSYLIDKNKKNNELKFIHQLLLAQVEINLRKKESEGKNKITTGKDVAYTRLQLIDLFKGLRTPQNLKIYNSLMIEANSQLQLLKFPKKIAGNFVDMIKTVSYNQLKEFIGEDPMTKFQNAQILLQNQMKHYQQHNPKEGSEPQMGEIKKQEKIIDLPNQLLNSAIGTLSKKNKQLEIEPKLFKDNTQLVSKIQTEFDAIRKSEDVTEYSETVIFGKGTHQEKSVLYKDLQNKSIDELKALGFQEVSSMDIKLDEDGNLCSDGNMPEEYVKKLAQEYNMSERVDETNDLYENFNRDNDYNSEYKRLHEVVVSQDENKAKIIKNALETGIEVNDPLYYTMIVRKKEWIENRVAYLKKHFAGEMSVKELREITVNKHLELAKKYSEIEESEQFMSPEEKLYMSMMKNRYVKDVEKTMDFNLTSSTLMDSDDEQNPFNFRSFVSDRMKEIARDDLGKKNYDYDRGMEVTEEEIRKAPSGRSKRKANKIMKL